MPHRENGYEPENILTNFRLLYQAKIMFSSVLRKTSSHSLNIITEKPLLQDSCSNEKMCMQLNFFCRLELLVDGSTNAHSPATTRTQIAIEQVVCTRLFRICELLFRVSVEGCTGTSTAPFISSITSKPTADDRINVHGPCTS